VKSRSGLIHTFQVSTRLIKKRAGADLWTSRSSVWSASASIDSPGRGSLPALSRGSQAATKLGSGEQESVSLCAADQLLDREDLRRRVAFPRFTTLG
jgi:hypothetical protein